MSPAVAESGSGSSPAERSPLARACPSTLSALAERMLPDLPGYINRVRIRAGIATSYILLAAKPEFEPLALSNPADLPPEVQSADVKQFFFTTLMRRYDSGRVSNLQEYHWLFLARQHQDWQFVTMYSTIGVYPAAIDRPPLPPRNSSDGSAAQAIKTWLRDCQTGNLQPPQKPTNKLKIKRNRTI
ncbi:hypothetical protein [Altericista sp. CCNU0014]|uniref:hypothetical protein n=1 Tax=Altericista sp. CCNU0014 TaxID=3082949 RepID=UPI00384DB841